MKQMPPHVRAEVQRILDGAARRLLREANANPVNRATGQDVDTIDRRGDDPSLLQ